MSATVSPTPAISQPCLSRGTLSVCVISLCLLVLGGAALGIAHHVLAPAVRQLGSLICCLV